MQNIVLIGMPGAGKSTVGVVLAKRLGYRFVDSDLVIQEHYGKLLEELIRLHGAEGFWELEEEINLSLTCEKTVIATGGSAVYGRKAMKQFQKKDVLVYLSLPLETIAERVGDLNARGVTMRPGQTLRELFLERTPLYEEYADLTVDCAGKELREIVLEIQEKLSGMEKKSARKRAGKSAADKEKADQKSAAGKKKGTAERAAAEKADQKSAAGARDGGVKREILRDKDIREPLFSFLEETYGKVRIIEEKNMGRSRADMVMVLPDALYGVEIKSDADTYVRLQDQVRDYDKYFDANIVVVGGSHGEHIREHVPEYWGIVTVEMIDGQFDFYYLRRPGPNPKMKWKRKLELLWRPELAQLQEWNGMPKYKSLAKAKAADKILERVPEKIPEELLRRQVSEILFERDYSRVRETLAEYRRGELDKQLERETDPQKREELLRRREQAAQLGRENLPKRRKRYRRRS